MISLQKTFRETPEVIPQADLSHSKGDKYNLHRILHPKKTFRKIHKMTSARIISGHDSVVFSIFPSLSCYHFVGATTNISTQDKSQMQKFEYCVEIEKTKIQYQKIYV